MHSGGFTLWLLMLKVVGVGTPRGLQGLVDAIISIIVTLGAFLVDRTDHSRLQRPSNGCGVCCLELLRVMGLRHAS